MAYGQNSNIALGFQNSFGTSLTNSLYFIPHLSDGVGLDIPPLVDESMRGINDEGDTYEGPKSVGGDIESRAQAIPFGVLCKAMMGDPVTVNSGGIYTHTFKPVTTDFDIKSANVPVTYYQYLDTGSAQLHYDLVATTFEIGIAQGELLRAKVGFVGGKFMQRAPLSPVYPTGKRFAWNVTSLSVGGAAKSEQMDLTITLDDSIEAMHTLSGSKFPDRVKRSGFRTVTVAGTLKFDNQDEYQQFISQSERELVVNFEGVTEIQSGYNEAIRITVPNMRYSDLKPVAGGVGLIEVSFTAMGKYNTSSGTSLEVTVVNTQAAY